MCCGSNGWFRKPLCFQFRISSVVRDFLIWTKCLKLLFYEEEKGKRCYVGCRCSFHPNWLRSSFQSQLGLTFRRSRGQRVKEKRQRDCCLTRLYLLFCWMVWHIGNRRDHLRKSRHNPIDNFAWEILSFCKMNKHIKERGSSCYLVLHQLYIHFLYYRIFIGVSYVSTTQNFKCF